MDIINPAFLKGLALLETNGGQKTIKGPNGEDSNNLYNIKDFSGKGYRAFDKAEGSRDAYRVYGSKEESDADLLGLLKRKYPNALTAKTPEEFAVALKQGGYATDPNYVQKLVGAINRANGGNASFSWKVNDRKWTGVVEGEQVPVERAPADQTDVLTPFIEQGLGDAITEARARGYSDKEIAVRLGAAPELATKMKIQDEALRGYGPASVLQTLREAGYGDHIDIARERGYSDKEIAEKLGGPELKAGVDARDTANARGYLGNAWEGAANAVGDIKTGAQQLGARITGDDARLAELQQQQRQELGSLDRRATDAAGGSGVGSFAVKAVPYVAAAAATGGAGLMPMIAGQGLVGAAEGALTPTTGEGQFGKNVLTDAALAAGGAGIFGLVGKGLQSTASRALRPSGEATQTAVERSALADKFELTKTPAMLNDRARSVLDAMPAAKEHAEAVARSDLSRQLLKGIGQEGSEITPEVIAAGRSGIYSQADDLLKTVQVPRDVGELASRLQKVVDDYHGATLKTYRSAEVEGVAKDLLDRIAAGELTAQGLVQARKNVMNNAWKADGDTKMALQSVGRAIDEHLGRIAPDAKAALDEANKKWAKLQVLEKIVEMTRGQNTLTAPQLATAVKTTSRNLFQAGEAPYQDLADAALKLYGPNTSKNLTSVIARQLGGHDGLVGGAALIEPTVGVPAYLAKQAVKSLMGRAVNSENPTVIRMLTGATDRAGTNGATNSFIAKALGASGDAAPAVMNQATVKALAEELRKKRTG